MIQAENRGALAGIERKSINSNTILKINGTNSVALAKAPGPNPGQGLLIL